jgi:hypothetical protein
MTTYIVKSDWNCQGTNWGADVISRHRSLNAATKRAVRETHLAMRNGCDVTGHTVYTSDGRAVVNAVEIARKQVIIRQGDNAIQPRLG